MPEWLNSRLFRTSTIVLVVLALGAFALRVGTSDSSSVDFRDPTIWLRNATTGDVVKVNATTGDVMAAVPVANPGESVEVAQVDAGAVVLNKSVGEFSRIDPTLLKQANVMTLEVDPRTSFVVEGAQGFLVEPAMAHSVDPKTLAVDAEVEVSAPVTPVVDKDGVLWFIDGEVGSVKRLSVDQVDSRSDPLDDIEGAGLVTVRGTAYVIRGELGEVSRIDEESIERVACIGEVDPELAAGTPMGSGHALVMVVDAGIGALEISDVESGDCTTVELTGAAGSFGPPVELAGNIYIPDHDQSLVHIVDAGDRVLVRSVTLEGSVPAGAEFELIAKDGIMWFNDPFSPQAGVMSSTRVLRRVQKTSVGFSGPGVEVLAEGDSSEAVAAADADNAASSAAEGDGAAAGGSGSSADEGDEGDEGEGEAEEDGSSSLPDSELEILDDLPVISPVAPTANDELVANFTFSDGTVAVGEEVFFTDASTGGPTNWAWDFNDGTVATGPETAHSWDTPGIFTVRLDVENETGAASVSAPIEVVAAENRAPQADFEFTQATVEIGESVTFTDTSTGDPTSIVWDFGDGMVSDGSPVEHAWDEVGEFVVTLTVANDNGESASSATIEVVERIEPPIAVPIASATEVTVGQRIFFTNESTGVPTSFRWDFGDGETRRGEEVRHAYDRDGVFTVTLTVENSLGTDSQSIQVTVVDPVFPPDARFIQSSESAENDQSVVFTSTSTNDPDAFTWNFGDGTAAEGPNVTHSWGQPGVYDVTLSVSNAAGFDSVTKSIRIVPNLPPPSAGFEFSPATLTAGQPVSFTDSSTGGSVETWSWNFDDATTGAAIANPTHIFDAPGTYNVTLTVTNIAGEDSVTRTLTVLPPPPVAGMTFAPLAPATGETVQFTDASAGGAATSWSWDFGDGSAVSTAQSPTHVFATVGSFDVTLTVENAGGSDTVVMTVAVNPPPPSPDFSFGGAVAGEPVTFNNLSVATSPVSYVWDFGDFSAPVAATNPTHTYAVAGTYTVTLQATDPGGVNSISKQVVVANPPPPTADFTASALTINQGGSVDFTDTSTNATSIAWTFESGSPATSTAGSQTVTWATPGSYLVSLTASNLGGNDVRQATITVLAVPDPVASFTFASVVGRRVQFTNTSTNANGSPAYTWSFGSNDENPDFTFGVGTHDVTLTACNSIGVCDDFTDTIVIIGGDFTEVATLLQVDFTGSFDPCGGASCSYSWNFGDGVGTSTAENPSYTYLVAGTYNVEVTVTGPVNTVVRSHAVTVVE